MEQGLPQAIVTAAFARKHAQLRAAAALGAFMKSVPRLLLRHASPRMDLQVSTSKMATQASRKTWRLITLKERHHEKA